MNMRRTRFIICLVAAFGLLIACDPQQEQPVNNNNNTDNPGGGTDTPQQPVSNKPSIEIQQADQFAIDALGVYYLWNKQINNSLKRLDPDTCKSPIPVVQEIRYHKADKEIDHWTQLTNNLGEMTSSVEGLGLTYGYDLQAAGIRNKPGTYILVVAYVVKDGPAEKAGLKRGDIILTIDGDAITAANIYDAFNTAKVSLGITHIDSEGYIGQLEKEVSLTAVDMWEDPILLSKTFDIDGKKVGYLVYNSFDVKSMETLPDVFRQFKAEGVTELILDLRYNGGGFVKTECELASLIAPPDVVASKGVFQTEVFNSILTDAWKDTDFNTYFSTTHTYKSDDYDISEDITDANPGLTKLYAIVTDGSASASEGLIVGLKPYMDVVLIGEQTYGKYCAGYMMSPKDLYGAQSTVDYTEIGKWGIYVMVSQFADKNGKNDAMPDGIPVNYSAIDNPFDAIQLGDENEAMLKVALTAAGKTYTRSSVGTRKPFETEFIEHGVPRGILIKSDLPADPILIR